MGEMGPDRNRGGKHLIVPPGEAAPVGPDDGYYLLPSTGVNIMFGFRTLDPDPARSQALVEAVRIYPYAERDDPAPTRIVSPGGRPWTGDQPRGLAYWERLHDVYQSEVVDERDRFYLAMLRQLGIEKGKPFEPDARLRDILERATATGEVIAQANAFAKRFDGSRYWPDRQWDLTAAISHSDQRGPWYDELLERTSWFYEAVSFSEEMKSRTPGAGQAYLGSYMVLLPAPVRAARGLLRPVVEARGLHPRLTGGAPGRPGAHAVTDPAEGACERGGLRTGELVRQQVPDHGHVTGER
jgi:hypothetical protein